jgi:hypothetical protein
MLWRLGALRAKQKWGRQYLGSDDFQAQRAEGGTLDAKLRTCAVFFQKTKCASHCP